MVASDGENTKIQVEAETFRLERLRAVVAGIYDTANSTFLLVVAIKYFNAGPIAKALLQTNTSLGLLITPLILAFVGARKWAAGKGAAVFMGLGALVLAWAALFPTLQNFVLGGVLGFVLAGCVTPLFSSIYDANYREDRRGKLFTQNIFLRIISSMIFATLAGWFLKGDGIARFPIVLGVYALAMFLSAWLMSKMPEVAVTQSGGRSPLRALRHVRDDMRFRWTLVSWMLLGYANLTMFPLRAEYLGNPKYGLDLQTDQIALYTHIIPNLARLCFTLLWGRLFDRMNFFNLRIILNTGFMLAFLSFFTGTGTLGLTMGAVIFGISNAGADVCWSLWVTKMAPPGMTGEYMSVHTFLTGVRGMIAPFVAFHLLAGGVSIVTLAWVCAALSILASLLLIREKSIERVSPFRPA